MAGHSHWAQVKHKKAAVDKKKSQIIGKLINAILIAARQDPNPETNPKLKSAIENAKDFGVSQEVIDRNIKKASGLIEGEKLEEIFIEGYAPYGVALIIKCITNNKNRTISEIKNLFNRFNGKVVEPGSVLWMFKEYGSVRIQKKDFDIKLIEELEQLEDFKELEEEIVLYFPVNYLYKEIKKLEEKGINILSTEIELVPNNYVNIEAKKKEEILKFINEILNHQDVSEVFSNLEE
ncbi:MAG: YebC/PmpR family DNA-binding transcriptional regulator [Candidatus Aenigmatarchaeota archaeon]